MYKRKYYIAVLIIILVIVAALFAVNNDASAEEKEVRIFYPETSRIKLVNNIADDLFISLNYPAVKRAYEVNGKISAFVVSCLGYNDQVEVLAAFDNNKLIGIKILNHAETEDYAGHIEESWFLDRFKNFLADKYLNLVVLDKENPEDIVQVTGATISSQAVVNGVNAAIGTYQYLSNNIKMAKVPDVVPRELWQKDLNSFLISWDDGSVRIDWDKIKNYEQVEKDVVLINTTGTKTKMHVKGPTLETILKQEGIELRDYAGIGIIGRDGYYTMVDKEKLIYNDVILAWEVDKKEIKDEEKPVRIVIPNELGPYWVKMACNIDLYAEISPKDIKNVYIFDSLTRDIEPYYYEYYGSKDKSIEIGKILSKFETVDEKGFFTMTATDGLTKNETISLVRQRYFIKVEGENSPMNIAPNFKLGMNVKHMTHFSTTKDAVIFPHKMVEVVRTKTIEGQEGLLLEDVLLTAGMRWDEQNNFAAINTDEKEIDLTLEELLKCYIVETNGKTSLYKENIKLIDDLLRIEKK